MGKIAERGKIDRSETERSEAENWWGDYQKGWDVNGSVGGWLGSRNNDGIFHAQSAIKLL